MPGYRKLKIKYQDIRFKSHKDHVYPKNVKKCQDQ